jgi:hypothetical protein
MSVLTVVQAVSMAVGIARPLQVFGSTKRELVEMQAILNEAASVILQAFDWQSLKKQHVIAGDGATTAFDLPDDYRRMLKKGSIWSSRYRWQAQQIVDLDTWMELAELTTPVVDGIWTIYGDQLHFLPTLGTTETIKFFYISNLIVKNAAETGGFKDQFDADADTFVLNERLLKLAAIYLWKQANGQDFAAELADYEQAMGQYMIEDKGAQPVVSGNSGYRPSSNVWPGKVSG